MHKRFCEEADAGRARIRYPRCDGKEKLYLLSFFDASLGKEKDGKSQLGAIHFVTTEAVKLHPTPASAVEWNSNKSGRVVRSSMAAEAASMSGTVDKHLYNRLVLDRLMRGERELEPDWRTSMSVDGGLVTDARSLYDHMHSTQLPTERQTMLDLLVAKDQLEQGAFSLYWVPTHRQFGDGLTKSTRNVLWEAYLQKPFLSLKETEAERRTEEHRAQLRRQQRQRRKDRIRDPKTKAAPKRAAPKATAVAYVQ